MERSLAVPAAKRLDDQRHEVDVVAPARLEVLGNLCRLHLLQSGACPRSCLLNIGGAKRRSHSDVESMCATSPDRNEYVAWAGVVVRNQRAFFSLWKEAGVSCLLKDGVAESIMAADPFVLCCADDGVIAKGIHWLIAGRTRKFGGGVNW